MATIAAKRPRRGLRQVLASPVTARVLFPFVVIAVWYFIYYAIDSRIFPTPVEVLEFMWEEITLSSGVRYSSVAENLYVQFAISIIRLSIGFVIAVLLGTLIGLWMGLSRAANAFFHDWVMAVLAMPALVWALFMGLVFGHGNIGPIICVIMAGIPFVIINVREGVRNTPRELFDMARAYDVPQKKITRHVLLPSMLPFFFAACRYAYSVGWKGLVVAEVFASATGMGWTIKFWYDAHRAKGVIGYALFFIIFAMVLEKVVFDPLAKKAFRWRPSFHRAQMVEPDFGERGATGSVLVAEGAIEQYESRGIDG